MLGNSFRSVFSKEFAWRGKIFSSGLDEQVIPALIPILDGQEHVVGASV